MVRDDSHAGTASRQLPLGRRSGLWYHGHISSKARIGTQFAGYRIEALLGRGGTSTVYRAESPRLGIRVALKILNPDLSDDEAFRERFVREARAVARIEHPNVMAIQDADACEDELYIAMRYVPSGDLGHALAEGPLDPARALAILAQAASGLDAAHAVGLVHRDVKPANLMLDRGPPGEPETVYVTDFGLTKSAEAGLRATPTGVLLGTVDYVAPEQIEGRAPDRRADVYSLGCVAFECLTGRRVFERENEAAVLWAHMQESPPAVSDLVPGLPPELDVAIARALAKDPEDRFASCGDFAAALRGPLEAAARDGGVPLPARRGRGWPRTLAAVLCGVVLGAAGVGASFLVADEGDSAVRAGQPPPSTVASTVVSTVVTTVVETAAASIPVFIPEQYADRCRVARPPTADFDASYVCQVGRGVEVRYSHALSGPTLGAFLRRRIVEAGLPPVAQDDPVVVQGSCAGQDLPAIEHWIRNGRAGHQTAPDLDQDETDGRVICYRTGSRAWIEWTTGLLGVYAQATAPSFGRLYRWWLSNSGPVF
jgi:serine/threonine protein kinase